MLFSMVVRTVPGGSGTPDRSSRGNSAHQMCCESSNLVAHSLGRQNGNLINDTLVGVEIEGQFSVVLLDDSTSTLLNDLCTETLSRKQNVES